MSAARRIHLRRPPTLSVVDEPFVPDVDAARLTHIQYVFANVSGGVCTLGDAYAFAMSCYEPVAEFARAHARARLEDRLASGRADPVEVLARGAPG